MLLFRSASSQSWSAFVSLLSILLLSPDPRAAGSSFKHQSVTCGLLKIRRSWATQLIGTIGCLLALSGSIFPVAASAREKAKRKLELPSPSASPGEQGLGNIPLVVGHEAKGLVLPDFDLDGRLRGKFEAGTARRIDDDHVGFGTLKITTYTPENTPDLTIEMNDSVLDLKTRVLTSKERTSIKRADFNITGDSVEFDTNARTGKLVGNVKMVITDQAHFSPKIGE